MASSLFKFCDHPRHSGTRKEISSMYSSRYMYDRTTKESE